MNTPSVNRRVVRKALDLRLSNGSSLKTPLDAFDFADKMGLEVRFQDLPSAEGLYVSTTPNTIILGSHRPLGRQRFTCAHEIAHHVFGHGTRVDQEISSLVDSTSSGRRREFEADLFAGFLLMPRPAVMARFSVRSKSPKQIKPTLALQVSRELGVSYTAFVVHSRSSLSLFSDEMSSSLLDHNPRAITSRISCEFETEGRRVHVDKCWPSMPVDLETGDLLLTPTDISVSGRVLEVLGSTDNGNVSRAVEPGVGRLSDSSPPDHIWARYVRVRRSGYTGLACFRHLADPAYHDRN